MNTATAQLNNHRQSPRKVRLIAGLVRGKSVASALSTLMFAEKKAAEPVRKLIESAVSNAKNIGLNTDALVIKEITVDGGQVLKRRRPMSRGRAFAIRKRTSLIFVRVGEKDAPAEKAVKAPKAEAKAGSKPAAAPKKKVTKKETK